MKTFIKDLKKGSMFKFNSTIYTVKQKFLDWKKNEEPYLVTKCGQVFWHDELEVDLLESENTILSTEKDKQVFFDTITNPREPNQALKDAYDKSKNLIERENK